MKNKNTYKILYISGSIGLGHVSNDYAIAQKIREINPNIEISWIATNPANTFLTQKGERLHPKSKEFASYSALAEKASKKSKLNLANYVLQSLYSWLRNVFVFIKIIKKEHFDIVVGNETYEIMIGLFFKIIRFKTPFIIIYDFIGLDSMSRNPIERITNYILNWIWSHDYNVLTKKNREAIFIGEPEDIPDKKFGFLMPNRRQYARANYKFIGHVVSFDPKKYRDPIKIRNELNLGKEPLIVCSIGGTSIGKELLELCIDTYLILKSNLANLHMLIVAGPRLSIKKFALQSGIEARGFVPDLYKYYAASDLAIVLGGGTSTMELTALRRPFIYFPIEGHSEQKLVSERLARHLAGVRMELVKTTPKSLAEQILRMIHGKTSYRKINTNGAENAAQIIHQMLTQNSTIV
jgi:UDP-N-acetylglucosamine:LPS N-acetylglucosamine transferase